MELGSKVMREIIDTRHGAPIVPQSKCSRTVAKKC